MRVKSKERLYASRIFCGIWYWVEAELVQIRSQEEAAVAGDVATSAASDANSMKRYQERIENEGELFQILRTKDFIWQCFVEPESKAARSFFTSLKHALPTGGAQAAIMLARFGILCQGEDDKTGPLAASAQTEIRKVVVKGGLEAVWEVLMFSNDEVTIEAGVVALYNLIRFIGEDTYLQYVQSNMGIVVRLLENNIQDLIEYLMGKVTATDCAGFLQYMSVYLVLILFRAALLKGHFEDINYPAKDMLSQMHSACCSLLSSQIQMCRLMGARVLWTLLDETPDGTLTILLSEIAAKDAPQMLQKMIKILQVLSSTEDPARFLGRMSLPPHFKKQPWCLRRCKC